MAVSEQFALEVFAGEEVLGKIWEDRDGQPHTVVAVFKDFGASIFPSEDLALLQVHANEPLSWGSIGGTTCFVRSDEPEDKLTADIDAVLETHHKKNWGRDETRVMKNGSIERMDRLYFSDLNNQRCLMKGNRSLRNLSGCAGTRRWPNEAPHKTGCIAGLYGSLPACLRASARRPG